MGSLSLLGGCSGLLDDEESGDGGDGDGSGNGTPRTQTLLDERYEISEDEYAAATGEIERDVEVTIEFTVREGPAVDLFVMTRDEFDNYQAGERFKFGQSASIEDEIDATNTAELAAGNYAFVVDNTDRGAAHPPANLSDDVATVEVTITATSV